MFTFNGIHQAVRHNRAHGDAIGSMMFGSVHVSKCLRNLRRNHYILYPFDTNVQDNDRIIKWVELWLNKLLDAAARWCQLSFKISIFLNLAWEAVTSSRTSKFLPFLQPQLHLFCVTIPTIFWRFQSGQQSSVARYCRMQCYVTCVLWPYCCRTYQ